jgi:hypothetical protein
MVYFTTDNTLYKCIVEGINKGMVLDVTASFILSVSTPYNSARSLSSIA